MLRERTVNSCKHEEREFPTEVGSARCIDNAPSDALQLQKKEAPRELRLTGFHGQVNRSFEVLDNSLTGLIPTGTVLALVRYRISLDTAFCGTCALKRGVLDN